MHAIAVTESFIRTLLPANPRISHLSEGRRPRVSKQLLASGLGGTVRERELDVLAEELLDVWAADAVGLLDLNNLDDLYDG